jgi:putative acetyltransferase
MIIRKYLPTDCRHLTELFYQTVHSINAKDYTDEQLNAWATGNVDIEEWNLSLSEHYSLVAIKNGIIAGFGDIDRTGYLDRLYVHKDYQSQGIATAICDRLEHALMINKITTHASITAKPFFLHRGYHIVKKQQVIRSNISLTNYVMEKHL